MLSLPCGVNLALDPGHRKTGLLYEEELQLNFRITVHQKGRGFVAGPQAPYENGTESIEEGFND